VQHVAHDADLDALERLEMIPQREEIEQSLCGVLVRAVAGVDHVRLDAIREKVGRTRRAVADHHHVDAHRLEIPRRVHQRLALRHARSRRRHVHVVRR